MKILYFITKSEAGGAQTHLFQLAKYFSVQGHKVAVCANSGGWLEQELGSIGIPFIPNKYFSNSLNPFIIFRSIISLKKVIKSFQPDLIHCHSSMAGFLVRMIVRNKIPTVFTAHGWGFNIGMNPLLRLIAIFAERIAARYCEKIICISKFVRDLALRYKITKTEKLIIIYNGVEAVTQALHQQGEKIKIVFIGRLADPKEPVLLLQAFDNLPQALKNKSELLIIGEGKQRHQLLDFISRHGLSPAILRGELPRRKILEILSVSDIFTLISRWEGLPITILEAMSAGLPIIASDVGGISEVVNNANGYLINNSVEQLTDRLGKLIESEKLRKEFGMVSYQRWQDHFFISRMLLEVEDLYKSLV